MNNFVNEVVREDNIVATENGASTYCSSMNACVDLFFKIGAMRGQNKQRLFDSFEKAFNEDSNLAVRILLWGRDAREGAGERQVTRDLLNWMEKNTNPEYIFRIIPMIPELGRWDDLLVFENDMNKEQAFELIQKALNDGNGLCAKWMPRKGKIAAELRTYLGLSPKQYRKLLVGLTDVVENKMCAKDWSNIEYKKVPSIASSRYAKAFRKHDATRYQEYLDAVNRGEVKMNAGAVTPADVVKTIRSGERDTANGQWKNLPTFEVEKGILPVIDVSGSMTWTAISGQLYPIDVAVGLGIYLSERNTGPFKDLVLPFESQPSFVSLKDSKTVSSKYDKIMHMGVGGSTDVGAAMELILETAKRSNATQKDMPSYILILSDMEFNPYMIGQGSPFTYGKKKANGSVVSEAIKKRFEDEGYETPTIVWWNIQSRQDNVPVKFDEKDMALVSGFSPDIMKSVISAKAIDPVEVMKEAVMKDRYNF